VIGVGINIQSHEVADAAAGVAALDEIEAGAAATTTLARIAPALFAALRRFDEAGFAPFAERFAARDLLRGRRVAGSGAGGALAGIAIGVAADGALLIETDGGVVAVASGEWRLAALAAAESPC